MPQMDKKIEIVSLKSDKPCFNRQSLRLAGRDENQYDTGTIQNSPEILEQKRTDKNAGGATEAGNRGVY